MLQAFPVARSGRPVFADRFGEHRGTDIFAPRGTPVLAVDAGEARQDTDPKGGLVAYLKADDGTRYYYAHLDSFTGSSPRRVKPGEQIGTVGDSGNAKGKDPHLHFEVHPNGGEAVNPFPLLADIQLPVAVAPVPPPPFASSRSSSSAGLVLLALALLWSHHHGS